MITKRLAGAAVGLAAILGTAGVVSADPPANKVEVPLYCPSIGETTARIPNMAATLGSEDGKTLVTGISTDFGPGVVFDLFGIYDVGRGHAPVDQGKAKGVFDQLEICTIDLSDVVAPGYIVPAAIKLTGKAG